MGFADQGPVFQVHAVAGLDRGLTPRQEIGTVDALVIEKEIIPRAVEVAAEAVLGDQGVGQKVDTDTIIPVLQEAGVEVLMNGAATVLRHAQAMIQAEVEVLTKIDGEVVPGKGKVMDLYHRIATVQGTAEI